ncbi:MAG: hypothetical protein HYZ72_16440, partial [Deltaproteobacteria bacterium]|nr:hypothetical protein [Deltaproteobacteria bacterium]
MDDMKVSFRFDLRRILVRLPRVPAPAGFDLQAVTALVARLSPRERRLVGAAGVALGGI